MAEDLVQWLGKQLDHDEAHARKDLWAAEKATPGRWRARYGVNLDHSWVETESTPILRLDAAQHEADALLVARFQPDTVKKRAEATLADVDVKRRTLIRCQEAMFAASPMLVHFAKQTAWEMAQPYSDRPGYREDWRP